VQSFPIDGIVSGETLNRGRRDGFVPGSEDRKRTEYVLGRAKLQFDQLRFLEKIRADFYDRTGKQLELTSGTRDEKGQAKAMYDNLHANRQVPYAKFAKMTKIELVGGKTLGLPQDLMANPDPYRFGPPRVIFAKTDLYQVELGELLWTEDGDFDACWVDYYDYPRPKPGEPTPKETPQP